MSEPTTLPAPAAPEAPEELADERLTLLGLLAETYAGIALHTSRQLAEHGLSTVEFEVMLRLARSPMGLLRMSDLSAQTSVTTSGVTRVVDRLQDRGLVDRQACATDRRSTYAVVTDRGRDLLAAALPGHLAIVEDLLVAPLREAAGSPGALEAFGAALRRVRDHVVPCATVGSDGAGVPAGDDAPPAQRGSAG